MDDAFEEINFDDDFNLDDLDDLTNVDDMLDLGKLFLKNNIWLYGGWPSLKSLKLQFSMANYRNSKKGFTK